MTRKEKREKEEKINFFVEFLKIKNHFFKGIIEKLKKVTDPRNKSYIDYGVDVLILMVLFKNIFCVESMSSMTESFTVSKMKKLPNYSGPLCQDHFI